MQARIVVFLNGKQELCVPIAESGAGIGRDAGNPVQLSMPEVSKRHAFVLHTPHGWFVEDLNSRNGLFVNGARVKDAFLSDGDRILVGPYLLVFQIAEASQPYKPVVHIDTSKYADQRTMLADRPSSRQTT